MLELAEELPKRFAARHIAQQLIRAGTGGGANYAEARAAESRADFVHKLGIAAKELHEARFWLAVIERSPWSPRNDRPLAEECRQLMALLGASASTARNNLKDR